MSGANQTSPERGQETMSMGTQERSVGFTVVGLGQCGGHVASAFAERGYPAVALNTSFTDLAAVRGIPEAARVYVGVGRRDGTGKDSSLGEYALRENEARVREVVERLAVSSDALLLCGGLGGGTGACLPALVEILAALGRPILAAFVMPAEDEPSPVKVNAVRACNRLLSSGAHGLVALGAGRSMTAASVATPAASVAGDLAEVVHEINRIGIREDLTSVRTFDGEDLRRVLFAGRFVTLGCRGLDPSVGLTSEAIVDAFAGIATGSAPLLAGHAIERSSFAALALLMPRRMLTSTPSRVFEGAAAALRERLAGAALYLGLYAHEAKRPRLHAVCSGLPIPDELHRFARTARQEGLEFCRKLGAPAKRLDVGPLRGLGLFGGHFGRARASCAGDAENGQTTGTQETVLAKQLVAEVES